MAHTRQVFDIAWARVVQALPDDVRPASAAADLLPTPVTAAEPAEEAEVEEADRSTEEQPDTESMIVKAPPERLSGSKAAEIRKRMLARQQATGTAEETVSAADSLAEQAALDETASDAAKSANDIIVRRARPSDVPSILLVIQRATEGAVKIKRSELLMALGDRGYLIGQQGSEISTVIGWNSENLIARIDQIFVYPPESAQVAGPAVLQEIEDTAVSLMCEVILAFPINGIATPVLALFLDKQFEEIELARLPDVWQAAVAESQPDSTFILMKKLRDTRVMKPV
jgi:hypothetical protein